MRPLVLFLTLAAAAATLVVVVPMLGSADPGGGATINRDFACELSLGGVYFVTEDQTMEVDAPSGKTVLTCHFDPADIEWGTPSNAKLDNFECWTDMGMTTDSKARMSQSGHAVLQCRI